MGFRCLLGCDYGEPELKREREERGEEVIVTVKEEETCTRCGKTRVVSENKEVTSIEQLAATAAGETEATTETQSPTADEPTAAAEPPAASAGDADDTAERAEPETVEETPPADAEPSTADDEGVTVTHASEPEPTADTDSASESPSEDLSATTDDGVILSDPEPESDPDDDRAAGEWPEYDDTDEWPEQEGEDGGYDATAPTDDGPDDVTFGGGFTPEASETADEDAELIEAAEDEQFTKAEEATVYEPTVDDIETEFYCPACGFSQLSGQSSMRAGDICPECRKGYIAERQR